MSVYRTMKRVPLSDVHHVTEHIHGRESRERESVPAPPEPDWTLRRKARPPETLLPMTARWMTFLPFQPVALANKFPRIANTLATLWARPDSIRAYMNDLLVDKRGGRKGFPTDVLGELHALNAYYATLHPDEAVEWDDRQSA
jgi:hypothetical protein